VKILPSGLALKSHSPSKHLNFWLHKKLDKNFNDRCVHACSSLPPPPPAFHHIILEGIIVQHKYRIARLLIVLFDSAISHVYPLCGKFVPQMKRNCTQPFKKFRFQNIIFFF